jgi:hypothetical protein
LAKYPEYTKLLREEIETIIEEEGWTKASMAKMRKLDSFFRETQRLRNVSASKHIDLPVNISPDEVLSAAVSRMTLKDFTFSDGTMIPKGQMVSVPGWATHQNDVSIPFLPFLPEQSVTEVLQAFYENPEEFDGFRFFNLREKDEQDGVTKYQMVNTSIDYVAFGHGKHAW